MEEESAKYVTALTSTYISDEDSSDDELTFEELDASYKELCIRSAEDVRMGRKKRSS